LFIERFDQQKAQALLKMTAALSNQTQEQSILSWERRHPCLPGFDIGPVPASQAGMPALPGENGLFLNQTGQN
jgi:hypothetical protein